MECPMYLRFRLTNDFQELQIRDMNLNHNHPINEEAYNNLPKQRMLNNEKKQGPAKILNLIRNKKLTKNYNQTNVGKTVTLNDLSNLKQDSDIKDLKFSSYDDLDKFVEQYQAANFLQLNRVNGQKLTSPSVQKKYPMKVMRANKSLVYYSLTYMCVHGRNFKPNRNTTPKRKSSTLKMECPMYMRFRLSGNCQELEIGDLNLNHNHLINEEIFRCLPKQRKLNNDKRRGAVKILNVQLDKNLTQNCIQMNVGKDVTLKDVVNPKIEDDELVDAVNFIKHEPVCELEILSNNEDNELEGSYFQNKCIKSELSKAEKYERMSKLCEEFVRFSAECDDERFHYLVEQFTIFFELVKTGCDISITKKQKT